MSSRSEIIDRFLANAGWAQAKRAALAGDASFRRYERVFLNGKQAVLMDAPPEKEDVRPFMRAGKLLGDSGLAPPQILASDIANGLLLLEDMGDDLYSHVLRRQPAEEEKLYVAATDVLIDLYHKAEDADYGDFQSYDRALLTRECALLSDWFLPAVLEKEQATAFGEQYMAIWQTLLSAHPELRSVFVMRDYHADNLLWLPERQGIKRVGLLDFQDAVIGSPAYDVVSFLEDARRDVSASTVDHVLNHYLQRTGIGKNEFLTAYALLGAQRNCKIIGIFVRLAVRDGKQQYLSYLPRVWRHLEHDMKHPLLEPLREWMDATIKTELRGAISINKQKTQATG
jgi:aminoglycoside/choline kinase family phosphotransferase